MAHWRLPVVPAAILAVAVSACSDVERGTMTGSLRVVGGPPPGFDDPSAGVVTVERAGRVIARLEVPGSGRFSVDLEPGRYELTGTLTGAYEAASVPCGADAPMHRTAEVRPDAVVEVRMACAVG